MLVSGLIAAPLLPSITSKVAIIGPFALAISDRLGFERKSPGAAGMFAAMFTSCASTAPIFLSASFMGYVLLGILPAKEQVHFSWLQWFVAALPWGAVMLLASFGAILLIYRAKLPAKPKGPDNAPTETLGSMSSE